MRAGRLFIGNPWPMGTIRHSFLKALFYNCLPQTGWCLAKSLLPVSFFERRIFICILTVIALSTILEDRLYSSGFPKLCYAYQFSYMSIEVLVCEDNSKIYCKIVNNNFSKKLLHNTTLYEMLSLLFWRLSYFARYG